MTVSWISLFSLQGVWASWSMVCLNMIPCIALHAYTSGYVVAKFNFDKYTEDSTNNDK